MGFFDILSFGADSALGAKPNFQQYYQDDQTNMRMLNEQVSRIEQETRDAADRMKRVQLTTGKGVNAKLQSYYDGLTSEMKQVIAKNPNYRTDPIQMQAVNAVMERFSNNEIIANDLQSKASYQQFRDAATKGVLTAREIADGEQSWKRYQDGADDVFRYSKAKLVDYSKDAIAAMAGIGQLNYKKNGMLNADRKDAKRGMQGLFANAEYADQALVDFKQESLEEQAKWLDIPVKEHMTEEEEQELRSEVDRRIASLSKNGMLADPIVDWATDRFYPYTRQQYDQRDLINLRGSYGGRSRKSSKIKPSGYFKTDFEAGMRSIQDYFAKNSEAKGVAFNVKLNAVRALVPENDKGMLVSDRMFIRSSDGKFIRLRPSSLGYMKSYGTGNENKDSHYNASLIGSRSKDKQINYRVAVNTNGLVTDENFKNFIQSLGINMLPLKGETVIRYNGKQLAKYAGDETEAAKRFLIEYMGGHYIPKQSGGISGSIYQPSGILLPYKAESSPYFMNDRSIERIYDEEVYMKKSKAELEADAQWQSSMGESSESNVDYFSGVK